jgi:DNA-binding GntR family transcriptional regulator
LTALSTAKAAGRESAPKRAAPRKERRQERPPTFDWLPNASMRTLSLPEQIAEQVGNAIIKGMMGPGQRIQEQELADHFEVSRGPVREALRILERDGMVQILPRRGAQVTSLDIDEVNEIFEIRSALFGLAAKLFAERRDEEALKRLKEGVARLHALARDAHGDEYVSSVYRLNMMVTEASGNKRLRSTMFALAHQTLRYSRLGLSTEKRRQQSAREWRALCAAVEKRQVAEAQKIAETLVSLSREMAVRLLRKEPRAERTRGS